MKKVQENLHNVVYIFYQRVVGEEQVEDVPVIEKEKKVGDIITELQIEVRESWLEIHLKTPPKERERRDKVNEASSIVQELVIEDPNCAK